MSLFGGMVAQGQSGNKSPLHAFILERVEEKLPQKFKYIDIVAIMLVILFAGIPTVVALAT